MSNIWKIHIFTFLLIFNTHINIIDSLIFRICECEIKQKKFFHSMYPFQVIMDISRKNVSSDFLSFPLAHDDSIHHWDLILKKRPHQAFTSIIF